MFAIKMFAESELLNLLLKLLDAGVTSGPLGRKLIVVFVAKPRHGAQVVLVSIAVNGQHLKVCKESESS
jgi:hypothetical protein